MFFLIKNVKKTVKRFDFKIFDGLVVGLSGGADSVALLFALLEMKVERIMAVHVNHNTRGDESKADEDFVVDLCKRLGVKCKVVHVSFENFTEEGARKIRNSIFEEARKDASFGYIALGHNLDDNAETVIMNLCRGSGLRGLCGIPPINECIIRPLIEVTRKDIEKYLKKKGEKFVTDNSNFSDDFTRNRVRNIILPMLEKEVNANVRANISKNIEVLRADDRLLDEMAVMSYNLCCYDGGLNISLLKEFGDAISRRVVRLAIKQSLNGMVDDIGCNHIDYILELAFKKQSGKEVHIPKLIVRKEYDKLIFSNKIPISAYDPIYYELEMDKHIYIENLKSTITVSLSDEEIDPLGCTIAFSYDKITQPLVVRNRLPGDRISLKSGDGRIFTKKLNDLFINEKLTKEERDFAPLLAHGSDILWVFVFDEIHAKYQSDDENEKKIYVKLWGDLFAL